MQDLRRTELIAVHYWAKFAQKDVAGSLLDALNDPKQYADGSERYNVSKLLNLFMAREIAKLPAAASGQVVVNTVNPGESDTPQGDTARALPLTNRSLQVWFQRRDGSHRSGPDQLFLLDD